MNIKTLNFLFGVSALLLYSCSPNVYSTSGQNVPMFKAKGEVSANVNFIYSDKVDKIVGAQAQGAYAISDKLAASFNVTALKQLKVPDSFWSGQGFYHEIAGGTYGTLAKKLITYEVFGGLGSGYMRSQNPERPFEVLNTNIFKPYIQPSIGISSTYLELAITPRVAYVRYKMSGYNVIAGSETISPLNSVGSLVFEPGVTLRTGFKGTKFQIQYNYSTFEPPKWVNGLMKRNTFSFGLYLLLSSRGDYYSRPY